MKNFENVAAMKLATLNAGQTIHTKGFSSPGDGGGATYLTAAAQAVDGYGSHVLANGNVALLQGDGQFNTAEFGAVSDESTDNTSSVQAALNAAQGKPVTNMDGAYFHLNQLIFPDNIGLNGYYILDHRANDDVSSPSHPGGYATNERVRFTQNSNASGYNNETIFSSGYSTGVILDARRDVDANNIGAGQVQEFGRASLAWRQDGLSRVQMKYTDVAGDTSLPGLDDGFSVTFIEPRVTLTGLDDSDFTGSPALQVNDMVRGVTSGARGWVKSFGSSQIIVTLLSGEFTTERLIRERAIQSTTGSLVSVSSPSTTTRSNKLGLSSKLSGNVFSNLQGDDAVFPVCVGGVLAVQKDRQVNANHTYAELILAKDLLDLTVDTLRWRLDNVAGDAVLLLGQTEVFRVKVNGDVDIAGGLTSGGAITSNNGAVAPIRSPAQLNDISSSTNVINKTIGLMVYNVTTNKPLWADGSDPGSVWVDATGAVAHTPS